MRNRARRCPLCGLFTTNFPYSHKQGKFLNICTVCLEQWRDKKKKGISMYFKELKKFEHLFDAIKEGKQIQKFHNNTERANVQGIDIKENPKNYRVKPEEKFRPFTFEEIPLGKAIKSKYQGTVIDVFILTRKTLREGTDITAYTAENSVGITPTQLLNFYTFEDGTPCGVKVE